MFPLLTIGLLRRADPMLILEVNGKRVTFFNEKDVILEVTQGNSVQFTSIRKGQYLNGQNLTLIDSNSAFGYELKKSPNKRGSILPPNPIFDLASDHRPPLHLLSAAQLESLFGQTQGQRS